MTPEIARLREACRARCAEFGDPACFELDADPTREGHDFCQACHVDAGVPFEDEAEIDPAAVVRPLL